MLKRKNICASLLLSCTLTAGDFESTFQRGTLRPAPNSANGAKILSTGKEGPVFVIKPSRGKSAQREVLAALLAKELGCPAITPFASLHHIQGDAHSVQPFLKDLTPLSSLIQGWLKSGLKDKDLLPLIDQKEFETLFLFILLTYDTDAHTNNLFAIERGQNQFSLIKLDNGLTFPRFNIGLKSALCHLPHAKRPLSGNGRDLIFGLSPTAMKPHFDRLDLNEAYPPYVRRVEQLKELAKRETITLVELIPTET